MWLVCGKIESDATTTKEKEIMQKEKIREDKIKKRLTEANQECCDRNSQIHWNKLEWVNPRSRDERKNAFCVSSIKKI